MSPYNETFSELSERVGVRLDIREPCPDLSLSSVGTVELGGDFVKTPIAIRERLLKIGPTGESIKTVLRDKNRRPVFTTL